MDGDGWTYFLGAPRSGKRPRIRLRRRRDHMDGEQVEEVELIDEPAANVIAARRMIIMFGDLGAVDQSIRNGVYRPFWELGRPVEAFAPAATDVGKW
jgi:hypothetical protein